MKGFCRLSQCVDLWILNPVKQCWVLPFAQASLYYKKDLTLHHGKRPVKPKFVACVGREKKAPAPLLMQAWCTSVVFLAEQDLIGLYKKVSLYANALFIAMVTGITILEASQGWH